MKHDRSHRRDVRRHADPSVICLPGPRPASTLPPRKEPEVTGAPLPIPDDDVLDAELLAHKNIFDAPPRMSRQARRKAVRAERKAARRTATERFVAGAPSLGEAAAHFSVAAMPVALFHELTEKTEERAAEAISLAPAVIGESEEPIALEDIAQLISATGPLIVGNIVESTGEAEEREAGEKASPSDIDPVASAETMSEALESEPPDWLVPTSAVPAVPIEAMTTPLPRNRALVPAKRSWLLRAMPWLAPRRRSQPISPALTQLQDLRVELVGALHRLDQIIEGLPDRTTIAH